MEEKKKRIFALDYGRGTMAGFYLDFGAKEMVPGAIMDKNGEPSGFMKLKDGQYRLGRGLYTAASRDFLNMEKYHVDVKCMPDGEDELQVEYAAAWRKRIMGDKRHKALFEDGCEEVWIIGCPTAWRDSGILRKYRSIFERAGYPNVIIVPESNAAMMHAQQTYGFMKDADKDTSVLCMDLGAYSSDSTFVRPGEVKSFGGYVGASLIDRMILKMNLSGEFCGEDHNSPEARAMVAARCKDDPGFRTLLLLHTKKLKETYFSAVVDGAVYSDGYDCVESVDMRFGGKTFLPDGGMLFELVLNDKMADAVIGGRSVKSVLGSEFDGLPEEVRNELGDKTWRQSLEAFVDVALGKDKGFARAAAKDSGCAKPNVILTGGASLMPFVYDVVFEKMPNANIYVDSNPMTTIAKGLAYFGPEKIRAKEFDDEFRRMRKCDASGKPTQGPDKFLNVIVSKAHDMLGTGAKFGDCDNGRYPLVERLPDVGVVYSTAAKMHDSILDSIGEWKRNNRNSADIVSCARSSFGEWFEKEMPECHKRGVDAAKGFVVSELNRFFGPLLDRHNIKGTLLEESDLDLDYAPEMAKWWMNHYQVFDEMMLAKDGICSRLPNPDSLASIFGKSREDIFEKNGADFRDMFAKWKDNLGEIFKEEFDKTYGSFKRDCMREILRALKRVKRSKLGELIIEESFEDSKRA